MPNEENVPVVIEESTIEPVAELPIENPETGAAEPTIVEAEPTAETFIENGGQNQFNENEENLISNEEVLVTYNLEEIPEYVELTANYTALQDKYNTLQ